MCDENGFFAEAEVTDGMLVSRRRFKRSLAGAVLRLKDRIEIALELRDFSALCAVLYVLCIILLVAFTINGFVALFHLLEVSRPFILPLGTSWNIGL